MICKKCGNNIEENMRYCGVCGTDSQGVEQQTSQQSQQTGQNGYYGYDRQYNSNYNAQNYNQYGYNQGFPHIIDKPDTLMNVLSFFFPIVGIILYFIERDTKPVRSKSALKWSLISIGVSFVFVMLTFAVTFGAMFFFDYY